MMNLAAIMPEQWGTVGSAVVSFVFFWDIFRRYCPPELRRYLEKCTIRVSGFLNPYIQISIHEYLGASHLKHHEAYALIESYLSENSSKDAKRFKAEMSRSNHHNLTLSIDEYERTTDVYNGVQVHWISGISPNFGSPQPMPFSYYPDLERRYYKLKFHKRHLAMIKESYLEHVMTKGKEIRSRNRQRRLYTNGHGHSHGRSWSHIVFEHPANFGTLAMEPEEKEEIIEDLLTFSKGKDYYARIGKAWKRGYLLYGPPGTGKSTMIAAMANLLEYDVYDLELTSVKDNTELRRLLTETTAKSIIVIEDIDCSLDLTGQRKKSSYTDEGTDKENEKKKTKTKHQESESKVTLSGLLNFIDGLWSACAGERLIVFTTNYVDKLDPALTRRGRMDKHIELSYCKYEGFKVLARNYLQIEEGQYRPLFESVEELIREVDIAPADVAEHLMPKCAKDGPQQCLLNLVRTLEIARSTKLMESELKYYSADLQET